MNNSTRHPDESDEERKAEIDLRRREAIRDRHTQREALISRLIDEGEQMFATKLQRCGNPLELTCTCCGRERTVLTRCDLKYCPSCQHALAARQVERYRRVVAAMKWPLFVTLTVRNYRDGEESEVFVRRIRAAFTKLRRLRWFKRAVVGGVASIECTNQGKGWHPHVHALIDCRWLSVTVPSPTKFDEGTLKTVGLKAAREVADQWQLCTGRAASCKVRRVFSTDGGDPSAAAREVLKYSVKGSDLVSVEEPIGPLIRQLAATRSVVSWGSCYRLGKVKAERVSQPCECGAIGECVPSEFLPRRSG